MLPQHMHTHAPQQHPTLLHAEESKSNKQGMGEGLMNLCIERLTNCICSLQENVSYLSYLVLSNVAFIFSISKFPRHPAKKVLHPEGCKEITQLVGDNDDGRVGEEDCQDLLLTCRPGLSKTSIWMSWLEL